MVRKIRSGDHRTVLILLYKEFPSFKKRLLKDGASKEQAQEIFQDALLLVVEKVHAPNFNLQSKLTTYLQGIGWLLWKNCKKVAYRNEKKHLEFESNWKSNDFEFDAERENRLKQVDLVLQQVDEKCRTIFRLFYFENQKMKTIAERLGYGSVGSVKTKKYKCIEQAIKLVRESQNTSKI